jgi:subtilisin family serine protease
MKWTKKITALLTALALTVSAAPAVLAADVPSVPQSSAAAAKTAAVARNTAQKDARPRAVLPPKGSYVEGELLVEVDGSRASLTDSDSFFGVPAEKTETIMSGAPAGSAALASEGGGTASWVLVRLAAGEDLLGDWNRLLSAEGVLAAQPNYIRRAQEVPASEYELSSVNDLTAYDPYLHSQTWLDDIRAPAAWTDTIQKTGKAPGEGVTVAVVDTGADLTHTDLAPNLVQGRDFVNHDADPADDNGHGTHVAGIIAAAANETGVRGVAWGAKILPVKVLGKDGGGSDADIAKGICWAAGENYDGDTEDTDLGTHLDASRAQIVNLSLGGAGGSDAIEAAVAFARSRGCLVAAAAGNSSLPTAYAGDEYYGTTVSPAGTLGVLTVMAENNGAYSNGDRLASFSNYDADPGSGDEYEIMAPGCNIISTYLGGGWGSMSGTSMACPVTAGAAAVLMGLGCSADEAWQLLVESGTPVQGKTMPDGNKPYDSALDLEAAVEQAINDKTEKLPASIANAGVSASLAGVVTPAGAVGVSGLDTSGDAFFSGDELLSTVSVTFENLGGPADVTITGTVGGAQIVTKKVSMGLDERQTVDLQIAGTQKPAAKDKMLDVELTLTSGETSLDVHAFLTAYDTAMPAGITYNNAASRYEVSGTVTVGSDADSKYPALILGKDLVVQPGGSLTINVGALVYEADGVWMKTNAASDDNYGSLYIFGAALRGANGANIRDDLNDESTHRGFVNLYGNHVYDPNITCSYFEGSEVYGTGTEGAAELVSAYEVDGCGFYNIDNLRVFCPYFLRSLVTGCKDSEICAYDAAQADTFVENYGDTTDSVLKLYAPDCNAESGAVYDAAVDITASGSTARGFLFSSVVGPMTVYQLDEQGNQKTDPAKVYGVYYQTVNNASTDANLAYSAAGGAADTLTCAAGSVFAADNLAQLKTWNFADDSPAFVTGIEEDWDANGGIVTNHLTFSFSTALDPDFVPYLRSYEDATANGASVQFALAENGKDRDDSKCTVIDMTEFYDSDGDGVSDPAYYMLLGGFTAEKKIDDKHSHYFGFTSAGEQSAYKHPVTFDFSGGDPTMPDTVLPDGLNFTVGAFDGEGTNSVGISFKQNPDKLYQFDGCLQFTLTTDSALKAGTLTPGEQLLYQGFPYGVTKAADGSLTFFLGSPGAAGQLLNDTVLFTLGVSLDAAAAADKTLAVSGVALGGAAPASWTSDSCAYSSIPGAGVLAADADGEAAQFRRAGTGTVLYGLYGADGKQLSVSALGESGRNYELRALLGSADTLKAFYLSAPACAPLHAATEIHQK